MIDDKNETYKEYSQYKLLNELQVTINDKE